MATGKKTIAFSGTRLIALLILWLFNVVTRHLFLNIDFTIIGAAISFAQIAGVVVFYEIAHLLVVRIIGTRKIE